MALQGFFSKKLMTAKTLLKQSPLIRFSVLFIILSAAFFIWTTVFYIVEVRDKENKDFKKAIELTEKRFQNIQSKLLFIDKRLLRLSSTQQTIRVLQDRYTLNMENWNVKDVPSLYIQNDLQSQKAIGPYGPVQLDFMPPIGFYKHLLNTQKKTGLFIENGKAYFVYLRQKRTDESVVSEFLLLIISLQDLLPDGVSSVTQGSLSLKFQILGFDNQFYYTPMITLSFVGYFNRSIITFLWFFSIAFVFIGFGYFDRQFTRDVAMKTFQDEITSLKDLIKTQKKEMDNLAESLDEKREKLEAIQISVRSKTVIQKSYESRRSSVKERFEKKLKILCNDLEQLAYEEPALSNLLEMSQTAYADLEMISFRKLLKPNQTLIHFEKELELISAAFAQELHEKDISYACLVEPVAAQIYGDLDTVRLILITVLKIALDRLGDQGVLSVHIKPSETHLGMIEVDVMDNGYHYEGAKVASLPIKRPAKNSLFDISWISVKQLLESYGGRILKQENAAHDNIISLIIPRDMKAAAKVCKEENVVSLFKA